MSCRQQPKNCWRPFHQRGFKPIATIDVILVPRIDSTDKMVCRVDSSAYRFLSQGMLFARAAQDPLGLMHKSSLLAGSAGSESRDCILPTRLETPVGSPHFQSSEFHSTMLSQQCPPRSLQMLQASACQNGSWMDVGRIATCLLQFSPLSPTADSFDQS